MIYKMTNVYYPSFMAVKDVRIVTYQASGFGIYGTVKQV